MLAAWALGAPVLTLVWQIADLPLSFLALGFVTARITEHRKPQEARLAPQTLAVASTKPAGVPKHEASQGDKGARWPVEVVQIIRGPSAATIREFQEQCRRASALADELARDPHAIALSMWQSEDAPSSELREALYQGIAPMLDDLRAHVERRYEHTRRRGKGQSGSWSLSNGRDALAALERRYWTAPTKELMWIVVEEVRDLHRRVREIERKIDRQQGVRLSGLDKAPTLRRSAEHIIGHLTARGDRSWSEIESAGILAGVAKTTLRKGRDHLKSEGRIRRAGNCWALVPAA